MEKIICIFSLLIPTISFTQQASIDWYKIVGGGALAPIFSIPYAAP